MLVRESAWLLGCEAKMGRVDWVRNRLMMSLVAALAQIIRVRLLLSAFRQSTDPLLILLTLLILR